MKAINQLFQNVSEFRKFVPGISANLELDELNSSAISARKHIIDIITPEFWDIIIDENTDSETRETLSYAFGNLIMSKAYLFDVISKRLSGTADVYKNEQETMRRQYLENYFNGMDTLFKILSEKEKYKQQWEKTDYYNLVNSLRIKTTREFNNLYGIDMSFLFFFRTVSLQREVLLDGLENIFEAAKEEYDLKQKLKLALSHLVVALALTRFDIIELPATIRSLFDEQKASRSGNYEQNRILALAGELRENAIANIQAVELALNNTGEANIVSDTSLNKESDKIYLIS